MSTINTNTQEVLDLRYSSKLTKEQSLLLDKIAFELKPKFTYFISNLLDGSDHNIQFYLTPLICRNNYDCKLFNRLCQIELIKQYFLTRQSGSIILDNPYLYKTVKSFCNPNIKIVNTKSKFSRIINITAKNFKVFIIMIFVFSSRFFASVFIRTPDLQKKKNSELTIIDTIFYKTSFKKKKFNDRHFPGILDDLNSNEIDSIYYIGYYYGIYNFLSFFRKLKSSSTKIIVIEKYLKFRDYVYAIFSFLFLLRNFKSINFDGCDITSLFMDSYYDNIVNIGSSEGILKYKLMYRLKQKGIKIRSFLMWFENLPNNRGTQIGLNKFYPDAHTNGYIGFFHSNTVVGIYPSSKEHIAGFLPNKISVIGKNIAPEIKSLCPELKVIISPALRFQNILEPQELKEPKKLTLLVALPIFKDESCSILELVHSAVKHLPKNISIKIKIHPGSNRNAIKKFISVLGINSSIIDIPMHVAILESSIVISSASSSAVESVLLGKPTLILSDRANPTKNPIPYGISRDIYAVCYDAKDIEYRIINYLDGFAAKLRLFQKIALEYRYNYIESYTPYKSKVLLGINDVQEKIYT